MKFSLKTPFLLSIVITFAACSTSKISPNAVGALPSSQAPTPLTEIQAARRANEISHLNYNLQFTLNEKETAFAGKATIQFEWKEPANEKSPLFLDFSNGNIESITLNGKVLPDFANRSRYDRNRIFLQQRELNKGENRLEISFRHEYNHNGHGLHRFVDPADQKVYIFSDLEPNFAQEIFPCFDQPDLKSQFLVSVDAPSTWQVVTNTRENSLANANDKDKQTAREAEKESKKTGRRSWVFPETLPISTYVFALIAGPYASFHADADGIPMRLFVRESLKKYVNPPEWFDISRKGLKFYASLFGHAYPFLKYDQILVPEFAEGAMENAGAVTFSERHVSRTKVTKLMRQSWASTILHEMAHMWFGDLVTMKWWNGLWLNESFATFMSSWAMSETTPIPGMTEKSAWEQFIGEKNSAYHEDQLVITHPIELPIPDTEHAFSNFDSITYGKGASVIKQLRYYLGDDNFRKGLRLYFQKHAFSNTRLDDFTGALSEASRVDLKDWQNTWLLTAGVNALRVDWECQGGKISKLNLLQAPSAFNSVLRTHRSEVGFFALSKGEARLAVKLPVTYFGEKTEIPSALGLACPAFVFPNVDDQDYVKVELDPKSLSVISEHLSEVDEVLTREMLWESLHEQVVDGKLSPKKFADIVLLQMPLEVDPRIEERLAEWVAPTQGGGYFNLDFRAEYLPKFETAIATRLKKSNPGSDSQLIWFHAFVNSAHSAHALSELKNLLEGTMMIPKLKIDQEVRWEIVQALVRNGATRPEAMIQKELDADSTDLGHRSAIIARVQIPDAASKAAWFSRIVATGLTSSSGSIESSADTHANEALDGADLRAAASNFHAFGQESFSEALTESYFKSLPEVLKSNDEIYVSAYTRFFFPSICTPKVSELTAVALKSPMPASAEKNLKSGKQENDRCLRARKL